MQTLSPFFRTLVLALVATLGIAGPVLAADPPAAKAPAAAPAPKLSGFSVRLPQGGQAPHLASALSAKELAARRPHYEALKPRARTNRE